MVSLEEACLAVAAARQTGLPVVGCLAFVGPQTPDPCEAAAALTEAGADVIGANCGSGPSAFLLVCRALRAATDRPLWIKPNRGLPEQREGRLTYDMTPDRFAAACQKLVDAGADFIGGCCGAGPAHIRALARALRREDRIPPRRR